MANQEEYTYSKVLKVYCDLCLSTFGQRKLADGYCINCANNLCADCCRYHKTLGVTKNHVVFQDTCNQRELNKTESGVIIVKCPSHRDKLVEYHCGSCDEFCCCRCKSESHKRCSDVELISDVTDDTEVDKVIETLQNIMVELDNNKQKLTENEKKMGDLEEKANAGFEEQREKLIESFDKIKSAFKMRIESVERESQSKLASISRLQSTLTTELASLTSNIINIRNVGTKCDLYKAIRKVDTDLPSFRNGLKTIERDNDIEDDFSKGSAQVNQLLNQMKTLVHTVQGACIRMQHN